VLEQQAKTVPRHFLRNEGETWVHSCVGRCATIFECCQPSALLSIYTTDDDGVTAIASQATQVPANLPSAGCLANPVAAKQALPVHANLRD
jgi:hypothetical protein